MKIGIVTVTYNSRAVLDDFFASLERQTHSNFALYVVDSASTDDTVAYVTGRLSHRVRLLQNECNVGFAAGTNQGVNSALNDDCAAILALNNDVVFGPDLLERLVHGLNKFDCDMTTPLMYYHNSGNRIWAAGGTLQPRLGYLNKHRGMGEKDHGQYPDPERISFAPLCCVLIRREVFERVGLLDEQYFTYTEDTDFMYRCLLNDRSLWYIPGARLWHKVSSLTGNLSPFAMRYSVRGRIYFLHKHMKHFVAWAWTGAYLAYFAAQLIAMKSSWQKTTLKCRAALEGYRMYRNVCLQNAPLRTESRIH